MPKAEDYMCLNDGSTRWYDREMPTDEEFVTLAPFVHRGSHETKQSNTYCSPYADVLRSVRVFLCARGRKPHMDCRVCNTRITIEDFVDWQIERRGGDTVSTYKGWYCKTLCFDPACAREIRRLTSEKRTIGKWVDVDMETKKQVVRDFREALGFEKAPTDSTFLTADLYKVTLEQVEKHQLVNLGRSAIPPEKRRKQQRTKPDGSTYVGNPKPHFLEFFRYMFPEEFAEVRLWALEPKRLRVLVEDPNFMTPDGEPNYELVYPVLKRFWELWTEHLGRTPTRDDVMRIRTTSFVGGTDIDGKRTSDRGFGLFRSLFPSNERRGLSKLIAQHVPDRPLTPYWQKIYPLMQDLMRFFLPDEEPLDILEVSLVYAQMGRLQRVLNYSQNYPGFQGEFSQYWNDPDMLRRWFKEVVLVGERIDPEGFPDETNEEDLRRLYRMTVRALYQYPCHVVACRWLTKIFDDIHLKHPYKGAVYWFVTRLWPEFDWDEIAMKRLLLGEKRVIDMLTEVYGKEDIVIQYRLVLNDGTNAVYHDTGQPHQMDAFILSKQQAVDVQGDHHYVEVRYANSGQTAGIVEDPDETIQYGGRICLAYRQGRDTHKARSYNAKYLKSVAYIPITEHVCAVKGVHGDLPYWHWFPTNETHPQSHKINGRAVSLARLFDIQGFSEIAQDIRSHFNKGESMEAVV